MLINQILDDLDRDNDIYEPAYHIVMQLVRCTV